LDSSTARNKSDSEYERELIDLFISTNDPPTYEQASFESQGSQNREEVNPPDYYKETGRVRREEEDQGGTEGEAIDMSQYRSSEEITFAQVVAYGELREILAS